MNRAVVRTLVIGGSCLLLAACEARPIPMQVIPNSTFMLPLQARAFGNDISRSLGVQDRQRGDLIVAICPQADPWCSPASNPPPATCPAVRPTPPVKGYYLGTRYVTTVMPHPASKAGLRGYLEFPNSPIYAPNWGLAGQDLALLDVPSNVCPGTYELTIRARPVGSAAANEVISSGGVDIVVLDVPGGVLNPNAANPFGAGDIVVSPDLADLVPNPTVSMRLSQTGWTSSYPAAAEIAVGYPTASVKILGAYQAKHLGTASLVSWLDDPNTGQVKITVVDPTRCTEEVRIVFRLREDVQPLPDPVNPLTAFTTTPQAQRLYDLNGSLITSNPYIIANPATTTMICGSGPS